MLTDRQRQVYRFIRRHIGEYGVAPKLREIGEALGIQSRGTVHRYLVALRDAGLITIDPDRARGVQLAGVHPDEPELGGTRLPLLGVIAAGRPIEAIPHHDHIDLSQFFVGPGRYVLRVQGESMIEAGILDGDMVVVDARARPADGDIVVALIDREEATLKYLYRNKDRTVTLQPANHTMMPMRYAGERIAVQGVVVGQFRAYD